MIEGVIKRMILTILKKLVPGFPIDREMPWWCWQPSSLSSAERWNLEYDDNVIQSFSSTNYIRLARTTWQKSNAFFEPLFTSINQVPICCGSWAANQSLSLLWFVPLQGELAVTPRHYQASITDSGHKQSYGGTSEAEESEQFPMVPVICNWKDERSHRYCTIIALWKLPDEVTRQRWWW